MGHFWRRSFQSIYWVGGLNVAFWKSRASELAYGIWYFTSFYAIVLVLFIFCYWRILLIIRRQAHAMANYTTAQTQSKKIQSNVAKTMIFVSAFSVRSVKQKTVNNRPKQ